MENADKIYVCRCEEVTLAEIIKAIDEGAASLTAVKVETNAGMGVCQGMICRKNIERMLSERKVMPELFCNRHSPYRFPVRMVKVGDMKAVGEAEKL